jgi:integrase
MHQAFGPLVVKLKYAYPAPSGVIYFQLPVPVDLQPRYGKKTIKESTKTKDLVAAGRQVESLLRKYTAEFAGLRAAPESSPKALAVHADALLAEYGLAAGDVDTPGADAFYERLDTKRQKAAAGDEELYEDLSHAAFMSPVELAAFKKLTGEAQLTLSDALELHLSVHPQRDDARFVSYQRRAFDGLLAITGDKPVAAFKRTDARAYLEATLPNAKTATVRRRLGVLSAVFATYIREHDLATPNPFASLAIPREGHDRTERVPFTGTELVTLIAACKAKDDSMRWILPILAGTGARLAEVVGLPLADIVLDVPIPHVVLQVHPWRDIKGAKGIRGVKDRTVPLVGPALWAAQRIVATAKHGQLYAFPQYTDGVTCKATHASNALNGWMRRQSIPHG